MTPTETATTLRKFAQCLRADKYLWGASLPGVSAEVGAAIESAIEIIDRLEEAESDALEQARLNGMGSEREAALMAKLEAAEKSDAESIAMYRKARDERDALRAAVRHEADRVEAAMAEIESLRAKIEAMEKQEPVAQVGVHKTGGNAGIAWSARPLNEFDSLPLLCDGDKLYLAQGAQPAPSVPEGWKLVPIEPTPGMIDAAEYVDWGDADVRGSCINAWDRMLAAAPEAKP